MKGLKRNKGITLIALVVTIIVLLILAGVTLSFVVGENGILKRATTAVEVNEKASAEEEANLVVADLATSYYEEKYVNQKSDLGTIDNYLENQLTSKKTTEGGYIVQFIDTEVVVTKNKNIISSGVITDGRVVWNEEKIGEDIDDDEEQSYEEYIDSHKEVDKKIHINSQLGDDSTGDGTKNNPYATLDKIAETGIIENGYSYAIILSDGEYELTQKMFELNCNKELNLFGNKQNTIVKVAGLYSNKIGGSLDYNVNLYRLVWHGTQNPYNTNTLQSKLSLYNVAFKFDFESASYSYFDAASSTSIIEFVNCTMPTLVTENLRTENNGLIHLTNCYGGYATSSWGINSDWNYQTNYITTTPQVNETYQIIEEESIWKNKGTGTNPDGTPANLGVYGGEYSWEEF